MDYETQEGQRGGQAVCATGDGLGQLTAMEVMQYGVVSVDKREPVHKAVSLLLERNISGLVVTDQGRLVGMLSEKDLLRLLSETEYLPGLVETYMTQEVTCFDVEDEVAAICRQLCDHSYRHAPILYRDKLVGMITRADLIRVYKDRFRPPAEDSPQPSRGELLAQDVMRHGLLTVTPETPLHRAMDLIACHHVTGLPVVNSEMMLLGIITEKDLLNCILRPARAGAPVGPHMTTEVVSFDRKTPLDVICQCLIENDFHRVPILDGQRLIGIISRSDILRKRASFFKPSTSL